MPPRTDAAPYGPNTPAVRGFLRDLARQSPVAWTRAARVYAVVSSGEAFIRADAVLGTAIENAGLDRARDAVVGPVVQLARTVAASAAAPGQLPEVLAEQLAEAALAAVLALVARDLIPADAFDTLVGPFADLVPSPGQSG